MSSGSEKSLTALLPLLPEAGMAGNINVKIEAMIMINDFMVILMQA